jgi:ferredoxin
MRLLSNACNNICIKMKPPLLIVRFEPAGVAVAISPDTNLFEAAQRAGVTMTAACGGQCDCGLCRVMVLEGELTPVTAEEAANLGPAELKNGIRLACCARLKSSARIQVER